MSYHLHGAVQRGGGRHAGEHLRVAVHDIVHLLHGHGAGAAARNLDGEDVGAHLRKAVLDALWSCRCPRPTMTMTAMTPMMMPSMVRNGAEFVAPDVLALLRGRSRRSCAPASCSAGSRFSGRLNDRLRRMGIAVVDHAAILQPDDALGLHGDGVVVGDEHHGVALAGGAAAACPAPRGRCGSPGRRWARRPGSPPGCPPGPGRWTPAAAGRRRAGWAGSCSLSPSPTRSRASHGPARGARRADTPA